MKVCAVLDMRSRKYPPGSNGWILPIDRWTNLPDVWFRPRPSISRIFSSAGRFVVCLSGHASGSGQERNCVRESPVRLHVDPTGAIPRGVHHSVHLFVGEPPAHHAVRMPRWQNRRPPTAECGSKIFGQGGLRIYIPQDTKAYVS